MRVVSGSVCTPICSKVSVGLSTKDKSQGLITRIENKVDRVLKIRQSVISPKAQTADKF